MKIKICGCSRQADIEIMNRCQPDYIGFVFAESRRRISENLAEKLKSMLNPEIKAVGVFVNEPMEHIIHLCKAQIIDMVQLHGDEDSFYVNNLKQKISCPIIKAFRFGNKEINTQYLNFSCDYYLFDTYHQGQYGGSGKIFNHSLIPEVPIPYFLAGGMNLCTIKQAVLKCKPYGIDISSGVEKDGLKDEKLVHEVIQLVKSIKKAFYTVET